MSVTVDVPVISITGDVHSDEEGFCKILELYHKASRYYDRKVSVDFYGMTWIDANLASLLYAITARLKLENNVELTADFGFLYKNFNVLFRNGWLSLAGVSITDLNKTTVSCKSFGSGEVEQFLNYLNCELMQHRGMAPLQDNQRKKVLWDLSEIYQNAFRHAFQSNDVGKNFFCCGQYYPFNNSLVLTMVDLGVGFLPPIKAYTKKNVQPVTTCTDAIKWALEGGNSVLVKDPASEVGGMALQGIHEYCMNNNGIFQIYTGNGFFNSRPEAATSSYTKMPFHFSGTVVNLTFRF